MRSLNKIEKATITKNKELQWLSCKPFEEDMTNEEWQAYCFRWEMRMYGRLHPVSSIQRL